MEELVRTNEKSKKIKDKNSIKAPTEKHYQSEPRLPLKFLKGEETVELSENQVTLELRELHAKMGNDYQALWTV
jgi:hypothetical protein